MACAVAVIQPLPFLDFLILTPILAFMAEKISSIRGERLGDKEAKKLVKEIWGLWGFQGLWLGSIGYWLDHIAIGIVKIFLVLSIIAGGFVETPLFYILIIYPFIVFFALMNPFYVSGYAIGKTADRYFLLKLKNQSLKAKDMKKEFKQFLKEGYQKNKNSVFFFVKFKQFLKEGYQKNKKYRTDKE